MASSAHLSTPWGPWNISCEQGQYHIDGLVQERCNSIANALELCLSCIKALMSADALTCVGRSLSCGWS